MQVIIVKKSDMFRLNNFTYNNLLIKNVINYNLTLNEFILLNYFINYNVVDLNISLAKEYTSLTDKMIFDAYNGLIAKNIIKICPKEENGVIKENISLDEFFNEVDMYKEIDKDINTIIKCYEKSANQKVTDVEREVISAWVQSNNDVSLITEAINTAKYNKTVTIRYIDKLLNEWKKANIKTITDFEKANKGKELFDYNWLDEE